MVGGRATGGNETDGTSELARPAGRGELGARELGSERFGCPVSRDELETRQAPRRRFGHLVGVSALATFGLAACTTNPKPPTTIPPVTSTTDAPTTTVLPTTTTTLSVAGQVLASWRQDETDFYVASSEYPISFLNPLLTQGFVPPALYLIRQNFTAANHFGWMGPKTYHVWPIKVLSLTPTKAMVEGCTYDTGAKVHATGKPVPGEAGIPGFGSYVATMIPDKADPGHWLISEQASKNATNTEGPCKGLKP